MFLYSHTFSFTFCNVDGLNIGTTTLEMDSIFWCAVFTDFNKVNARITFYIISNNST